jgi:NAD(P)-dependent dehydrogenase (short-subunit alcohol dehydrogenase family)
MTAEPKTNGERAAIVTGASSGIGLAITKAVLEPTVDFL